jgi:hypothetical protein
VTASGVSVRALATALGVNESDVRELRCGEYVASTVSTPSRIADLATFLREHDVTLVALEAGHSSLEEVYFRLTAEDAK